MSINIYDLVKSTHIIGEESLKKITTNDNDTKDTKDTKDTNKEESTGWWKKSEDGKKRVMLCGTYPIGTSNGYSKVVYYIAKYLGKYDDISLTIYGFQNVNNTNDKSLRNDIPASVKLHDVLAAENPKRNGFGEVEIGDFIKRNPQDVIIIFNDNMITTSLTSTIIKECGDQRSNFKLWSYMDQVYPYQKKNYIDILNAFFDGIITFTPYWKEIALKLGIKKSMPIHVFPHGFDTNMYYPIPKDIARIYFKYNVDDFMVLNLNRNQPRKCWDHTIIAWVEFVEMHYNVNVRNTIKKNNDNIKPIKLIIGTQIDAFWNLWDVIENEVKFRDVPFDYVKDTIVEVAMPQQLSDKEINILYNCCDIGCNNCNGGGYELTVFECLGLGIPQVASYVGGIREYLNDNNSIPIKSTIYQYLDNKSNGIGGKAEITDPHEFALAFWKYFNNPQLRMKHGKNGRENILKNYRWETLVKYFHSNILSKI